MFDQALCSHLPALGIEMIGGIEEIFIGQAYLVERSQDRDGGALFKRFEKIGKRPLSSGVTVALAAGRRFEIDLDSLPPRGLMKLF
jgi:hypothetical protein